MDKVVAAVERFRDEMARAGIIVSGFEVATETQLRMLEAMGAAYTARKNEGPGRNEIAGLGIIVKGARP